VVEVSTLPSRERRSDDRDTYVFELSVESDLSDCSDRGFKLIIQGSRNTHRIFSPMYVPLSTKRPAVHRWSTLLPVALLWRMEAIYLRGYQRTWWPDERSCRSRASGGASLQDQKVSFVSTGRGIVTIGPTSLNPRQLASLQQ
jgi:hypothetical protein